MGALSLLLIAGLPHARCDLARADATLRPKKLGGSNPRHDPLPARVSRPNPATQLPWPRRWLYTALHAVARGEVAQPRVAVFMVGLPGAGKSRVIGRRYETFQAKRRNSTTVLDLDIEIAQHPSFDPADPDRLYLDSSLQAYAWADQRIEARFERALTDVAISRLIVDGTGTNLERQVRRMEQARQAGLFVKALYIRVPCRTAIARAALRRRAVSPVRIMAYHEKMDAAMRVARRHADEVEVIDVTFDDAPQPGTMAGIEASCSASLF
mmetsp:Transcript_38151/g.123118  ORF Transcript_38151/g.123118 Transcript_38151/m.123118 type:complete len:268 (+) Transcript_38151:43-846(+)